ncbi:MAG TPA: carboxylesterase family protein [Polyangiaceae bacterium]|nr:carboxylesterase family protein [Polyangiaceae bacterium]
MVDGQVLPEQPEALIAAKKVAVPVLHGANTAEGVLFHAGVFGDTPVMTTGDYQAALMRRFGGGASAVAAQYPAASFASPNDALTQVTADAFFVCPARKMAKLLDAAGSKSYHYTFNGTLAGTPFPALAGKAFHSSELPYVFGASYVLGSVDSANQPLVDAIEGYWTRFARTGDPNGGSDPMWPVYTTAADQSLKLDTSISVTTAVDKANCDFWDTVTIIAP